MKIRAIKAKLVENGYTQATFAKELGMSVKTFNTKLNRGVFGSDEMKKMIDLLHIENPADIFFGQQ